MIRVVRKTDDSIGAGAGMYRTYCDECTRWLHGLGKAHYLFWWKDQRGAERAATVHQCQHEALSVIGKTPAKGQDIPPGEVYEDVSSLPTVSVGWDDK